MVCSLFPNYNDHFIRFSHFIYISLTFIARFTCSNGLVCCVYDNVNYGDKAGFHAIEGYWEAVTANLNSMQLRKNISIGNKNHVSK